MGPLALFLMAGGQTFEAFSKHRQLKKQEKSLKQQAMEIEAEKRFTQKMSGEKQLDVARRRDIDIGASELSTAGAGLRLGGSASRRREAIHETYGRRLGLIRFETGEQMRRLSFQAAMLRKRAKSAGKAAQWSLLTGLLGAGSSAVSGASKMGMFSKPPPGVNYQKITPTMLGDIDEWLQMGF